MFDESKVCLLRNIMGFKRSRLPTGDAVIKEYAGGQVYIRTELVRNGFSRQCLKK